MASNGVLVKAGSAGGAGGGAGAHCKPGRAASDTIRCQKGYSLMLPTESRLWRLPWANPAEPQVIQFVVKSVIPRCRVRQADSGDLLGQAGCLGQLT